MKLKAIQKAVALSCATLLLAGGFSSFHKVVKADSGSAATQTTQSTFISQYKGDVQKAANKYRLYASVMMAQAALESGWGQSQLTKQANNFFGIKGAYNGQAVSMPTTEYDQNGQIQNINTNFKKYPTAYESFSDNGNLLRNGISGNSSYYSGAWKENANTYQDAANSLTGKYATAPNYGSSLITLIQQYNLDQTFSETGNGGSGSNNSNSDNSGSNSSNSGSNSSNLNDTGTNDGSAANPGAKPLDTAKYTSADPNQMVLLSPTFNKYYAYNHVKGTSAKEKRYSFKSLKVTKPVWVYLDMKAKKAGTSTNWYRIRFYKNQKTQKFWVYSPVLAFPETFYNTNSGSITVDSKSNADIYNHVYGSDYLAKSMGKISKLQENVNYVVDGEAIVDNSQGELWYRIKFNGTSGWIKSSEIKSYTANVVYVKVKLNKKLASTVKSGYAYNHVPNTTGVKKSSFKTLGITNKSKLVSNMVGYDVNSSGVWYRIIAPKNGKTYWISNSLLS